MGSGCRTEGEGWRRTADPSAPVGMTKWRAEFRWEVVAGGKGGVKAHSRSLRSGRDDKGEGYASMGRSQKRAPFDFYRCRKAGDSAATSKVARRAMFSQANQSPQRE